MSEKTLTHTELCSLAGNARAKSLSSEERKEIAKQGGLAKSCKGLPRATHGGTLKLGDKEIDCGVLPDKTRVISCSSITNALGLSRKGSEERRRAKQANLPTFLMSTALTPYFQQVFDEGTHLIEYVNKKGSKTQGMKAEFLPKICEIYLKAMLEGRLQSQQIPIAKSCEIILSALAKVGVIALVDESSGYQEERAKNELQQLLEKYISEELRPWTLRFPNEFFKQIYRLHGWDWPKVNKNHPQYVGKLINDYIYKKLPPGILEELEKINPTNEKGIRNHRHHQFLTDNIGDDNLQKQITQVVTLMRVSDNLDDFKKLAEKI
jgi:hypothetical protein